MQINHLICCSYYSDFPLTKYKFQIKLCFFIVSALDLFVPLCITLCATVILYDLHNFQTVYTFNNAYRTR